MEQAKSLAWKAVGALAALFFLVAILLFAVARTSPAQENARAAQAAGQEVQSASQTQTTSSTTTTASTAKPQSTDSGTAAASGAAAEGEGGTAQGQSSASASEASITIGASESSKQEAVAPTVHPAFDVATGAELYAAACQSCHMPGGTGAEGGAGTKNYPKLAGNPNLQTPAYPATFILNGVGAMPSFSAHLTDEQVAMLVNYLRHDLNKFEGETSAAEIAPIRQGARKTNLGDDAG